MKALLHIIALSSVIISLQCESNSTQNESKDVFADINSVLQDNWTSINHYSVDTAMIPRGLWDPLNTIYIFRMDSIVNYNTPTLLLFVYPINEKQVIDTIIEL